MAQSVAQNRLARGLTLILWGVAVALALFAGSRLRTRPPAETYPLDRKIHQVDFTGERIDHAIQRLGELANVPITFGAKVLADSGVDPATPIDLHLHDVTLKAAFDQMLLAPGGSPPSSPLALDVHGKSARMVQISAMPVEVHVYDVHDLLERSLRHRARHEAEDFSLNSTSNNANQNPQANDNQGHALFSTGVSGPAALLSTGVPDPAADFMDDLVRMIGDFVSPEIWMDNGGSAKILTSRGTIVVIAPRDRQREVEEFLRKFRESDMQVPESVP